VTRRLLLALSAIAVVLAAAVVATGGFITSIGGVRLSARSPRTLLVVATVAGLSWAIAARRHRAIGRDLVGADDWLGTRTDAIALGIAAVAGAVAVSFQTFSAAGADASGYFSEAAMLARAELTLTEPLGALADWPDPGPTLVPLGWRATADPAVQVPTYAIGLPLLMAPLHALGGALLASLIGPISLALAVWSTARIARHVAGAPAALLGAIWLATSPVALISAMQPMSDMPAAAAWLVCWAIVVAIVLDRREPHPWRAGAAGIAAALAVLLRPNIAPVAALPAVLLLWQKRRRAAAAFVGPVLVAGVIVACLQWRWFGSPLRSGYGTAEEIYALSNIAPNVRLYTEWLLETHGPWLLAAPLALFIDPRAPGSRRVVAWLLAFAGLIVVAYLVYAVFEVWTYLRFLLPSMAIAMIAVAASAAWIIGRSPAVARFPLSLAMVVFVAASQIHLARTHQVFQTADRHARALLVGKYLESAMPEKSVIVAGEQSGALRYYTNRSILRWEVLTPEVLNAATARASALGYDVWIGLDEWEEDLVRARFRETTLGRLDWPPLVDAGRVMRSRAWRLRDREPFLQGKAMPIDRIRE
jgi:hypothetical protein